MFFSDTTRRFRNNIKILVKKILGRGYYPRIEYKCKTVFLGSDYGGWEVATGFIHRSSIVYSLGVGEDVSFDLGLIEAYGLDVYAFDPTPKSFEWVSKQKFPLNFKFSSFGVADFDGNASFLPPDNPAFVSYKISTDDERGIEVATLPVKRLATLMKERGHAQIDLLKMDIEGAEYSVIDDMKKSGIYPKQILVEFHHRWFQIGVDKTKRAILILNEMGYKLFYTSARDEFGFLLIS